MKESQRQHSQQGAGNALMPPGFARSASSATSIQESRGNAWRVTRGNRKTRSRKSTQARSVHFIVCARRAKRRSYVVAVTCANQNKSFPALCGSGRGEAPDCAWSVHAKRGACDAAPSARKGKPRPRLVDGCCGGQECTVIKSATAAAVSQCQGASLAKRHTA